MELQTTVNNRTNGRLIYYQTNGQTD